MKWSSASWKGNFSSSWLVNGFFLFLRKCPRQFPCCLLCYFIRKRSSSRSQMFSKTGALKNFVTFAGKYLYWILFLKKFQDWRSAFLFKKTLQGRRFSVNIEKFFRTAFPAGTSCLWEISIRSPLREISQTPLRNISKEMSFLWSL